MSIRRPQILAVLVAIVAGLTLSPAASAGDDRPDKRGVHDKDVRFATFNASLNGISEGELPTRMPHR